MDDLLDQLILLGLGLILVAVSAIGALNVSGCRVIAMDTLNEDEYLSLGNSAYHMIFERDYEGADTAAELTLWSCTREDQATCMPYEYDTDADGVPDSNILTGTGIGRGLTNVRIAGMLYIKLTTAPLTGTSEFRICESY